MSEDEGPDSDSSGREFRRSVVRPRSRRRSKEARVCYSSRTTMSLQDPMPEYIDPELVKLIAQNAPFELDVFVRSLHRSSTKWRAENGGQRERAVKEESERRPLAVEALLSSVRERNDHLSTRKGGLDLRHSSPDRIWSDYDETDENICRATTVKRKRPKSVDTYRLPPTDRQSPSEASIWVSENEGRSELRRRASLEGVYVNSSDEGSNCPEDGCLPPLKPDANDGSSAPAPLPVGNDGDMLSAKPWRHGMRKGTRSAKDERPPLSSCCKRKAETDSRKTSEVRKYMETKMAERRKEQQQLKAEADAALAARKEQQRKLDLHRQAMFQSQVAGGKSGEHSPRPAWVSEYTSLSEPPRPLSSSSGELDTYLPPPVTPPKVNLLDLYATQLQYTEGRPSTPRVDGLQVQKAQAREKRRSKKARGCSREERRQLKYKRSEIIKEFAHTGLELAKLANSPVTRNASWKAKTKLRGRKLSSEKVFQRQLFEHDEPYPPRKSGDLEVYKRSLKRQFYSNGGSLSTSAKASRTQKSTSRIPTKTSINSVRPTESCVKSAIKDHPRPLTKAKRLKATQHFIPCKAKELTGEELATLLNANRVLSDCESETNRKVNGEVIRGRLIVRTSQTSPASEQESITDLRKCVEHSLGSPQKNSTDEDVLCKWFGPSLECSAKHFIDEDVMPENTGQMLNRSLKSSRNKGVQLQVLDFQKEKTGDTDMVRATSKNSTLAVRWQRMQLLKNLAEQLVKRVDEACAKKRQIEHSAVVQINSPPMDINMEPSEQLPPTESGHEDDSLEPTPKLDHHSNLYNGLPSIHLEESLFGKKCRESDPKFFHKPKLSNIIHDRELTEQEQAGCESCIVQVDEMQSEMREDITGPRRASIPETTGNEAAGEPVGEICTMMDWNTSNKGTEITCNNPSTCSSFGPSTASSSPVVLPTSKKYHARRIKHSKMVSSEEKAQQPKKEDWIIPAENDTHSIYNVYRQHLKDREKLAASTLPPVLQNDLDNRATDETEIDPGIVGPAAEEDAASIPLARKLTIPEFPLKMPEPMSVQRIQSAEKTRSYGSDGTSLDLQREQHMSFPDFGSLQELTSEAQKSAVRTPPELIKAKTDAIELAGLNPEMTILEIGDLKVCQSPTSFHLRLERCKDDGEDRKAKQQKLVNICHGPNVGNCTEASANICVDSKQENGGQRVKKFLPSLKITYARRVQSGAQPDGGCADDERVVVELHQMNAGVPTVSLQGDIKLDSLDLDVSEAAPKGLASPLPNKAIGITPSGIQEERVVKQSTVNEDFKEGHTFRMTKGNGALEPLIDRVSDLNQLVACEGETGSPCTMLKFQKGELPIRLNHNSKPDPQTDYLDSDEWELKFRRDQLEAELKKLDVEIMKTRTRLHQRHSMTDSQAHSVSSNSLADQPVECGFTFDKTSNIQKKSTKQLALDERNSDVFEARSGLHMQNIATTELSLKSRRDGEKTVTTSNSYSDSFVSEDTEMGQKIPETGKCDSFADHLLNKENINDCGRSSREPKTVIQQFEAVLEDRPQGSQSKFARKQAEALSHCKMSSTKDDFASEGSEISTGRGPGRRLDKPPEESIAHRRISKVRPVPDQMFETDVEEAQLFAKEERIVLQSHPTCIRSELLDAPHDLVNPKDGRGPWTPLHSLPQQIDEKIIRRNEGQTSFQQNRRNSRELLEYGARESPSLVAPCEAQNVDNSKDPMPWEKNDRSTVTAGVEILPGNRTPLCIQQSGWPVKGVATSVLVEVPPCSIGEQKEGRITNAAIPSTLLWSAQTSENRSDGIPGSELGELSQTNEDEIAITRQTLASSQNAKTLFSAEDSPRIVAAETSQTPVELRAHPLSLFNTELVNEVNLPYGSPTEETTHWECLSLPSHMDFSTIKEKLRNNKLTTDEHPITDGWSITSQKTSFDSPTSTTGGDSSGGLTVVSESIIMSGIPHNSKNSHENSNSLDFELATNSKCPPEMEPNQENVLTLLSQPESTNNIADPNNSLFGTEGLILPVSSTRELPSFLPSLYFHQQVSKSNLSEEGESTISEDLELYELDVDEDFQQDEGPSSGNFETTTCTSPPLNNDFTSPISDSAYGLGVKSPNLQVFHSESGLGITNGLTSRIDHVYKHSLTDCIDQDLTGGFPEPCGASGIGSSPAIMPLRCPANSVLLCTGGQKKSLAATCASPESCDGEVIGSMQSTRATISEDISHQGFSRVSVNYFCGSEVSGSHLPSESISEEVPSGDSEISSNGSGLVQGYNHCLDMVELNTKGETNEEGGTKISIDNGKNYTCNAVASSLPSEPDFIHHADKQHSKSVGETNIAAVIAKQNQDVNLLSSRSCVPTTNFQESASDNSNCHVVHLGLHHESESSKPVELPLSFVLPPLRPSKHYKQCDGTHFSNVLRTGKLSAKETHLEEALSNNEERLFTSTSGLQLETAFMKIATETLSAASPAAICNPGGMAKTLNKIFHCEQINPGTVSSLDVTRGEGNAIPVQKAINVEVICLSSHQMGPLPVIDAKFSVDVAQIVDCNTEESLAEELEETGQLYNETDNLSKKLTAADSPSGNENINVGDEVIDSAIVVPSHNISGYPRLELEKVPYQDKKGPIVSIPDDRASLCAPTLPAKDMLDSCLHLTNTINENELLDERTITKMESNRIFDSFYGDESNGGPPTSEHQVVPANTDVSYFLTEDRDRSQNISLRPDLVIALQSCQASTCSLPSPLLGHQKIVTDFEKDIEYQKQDKVYSTQVKLQYKGTKTKPKLEGHADQIYSNVCSLEVLQTDLPSNHGLVSESPSKYCSNKEGFLSQSMEYKARNLFIAGVPRVPIIDDFEVCSDVYSSNRLLNFAEKNMEKRSSLIYMEEKEQVRGCEIHEGVERLSCNPLSFSGVPKEETISTTCLTTLHKASCCTNSPPKLDVRMQMNPNRAKKLDMTDLLTSMIYEDLLSVELSVSGFHQEVERIPTSLQISSQASQTINVTKTINPKLKRSRTISEFCQVLKHFLPTGWRSASVRHKTGLFLHVEGLKPHPLNPATRAMPGSFKLNVQYPCFGQSKTIPKTTNTQFLFLDLNDVLSYVQSLFELSNLILDPSPANWYDPKKPVGEHIFSALESQFWGTGHMFGNSGRQIHKKLIADLINETLLKQFSKKLLVPSLGMKTLPLPVGGKNLVQFVTNGIVEHERYASKHGFDIEKVIAKAFEDEHWEKCSEEARDIVGDLAQGILSDLIERFVYEMVRGWGYYINQCHLLAA